jgi:uncharacterized protein YihD (DUF1040 family)
MRDPSRIDPMLATLREAWLLHPDMRLGQLICNLIRDSGPCPKIWDFEDTAMAEALASFVRRHSEPLPGGAAE